MGERRTEQPAVSISPEVWAWLLTSHRTRAGITSYAELARQTQYHPSYVGKVENRERKPARRFAEQCDEALNTGGQLTDAWDRVDWEAEPPHPDWFEFYADLESTCAGIRGHDVRRVWGLLQTAAYARALTRYVKRGASTFEVEETVDARLARQGRFLAAGGPPLVSILDEAVIRQVVGGPLVMREQLQHLLDVPEQYPHITVQVAPFDLGERTGAIGSVTLIETPNGERWAYSEVMGRGHIVDDPEAVTKVARSYDRLRAEVLSARESANLIRSAMRGLNNVTTSQMPPKVYSNHHADWHKSTYSEGDGGNCVEAALNLAETNDVVPVRDSKDRSGPELGFSPDAWTAFVTAVRTGDFGTV
ncbi:Scr1 family TA system antitoxin-like transcriptional regulator [Kitasatospora sp. NPDC003701]